MHVCEYVCVRVCVLFGKMKVSLKRVSINASFLLTIIMAIKKHKMHSHVQSHPCHKRKRHHFFSSKHPGVASPYQACNAIEIFVRAIFTFPKFCTYKGSETHCNRAALVLQVGVCWVSSKGEDGRGREGRTVRERYTLKAHQICMVDQLDLLLLAPTTLCSSTNSHSCILDQCHSVSIVCL